MLAEDLAATRWRQLTACRLAAPAAPTSTGEKSEPFQMSLITGEGGKASRSHQELGPIRAAAVRQDAWRVRAGPCRCADRRRSLQRAVVSYLAECCGEGAPLQ